MTEKHLQNHTTTRSREEMYQDISKELFRNAFVLISIRIISIAFLVFWFDIDIFIGNFFFGIPYIALKTDNATFLTFNNWSQLITILLSFMYFVFVYFEHLFDRAGINHTRVITASFINLSVLVNVVTNIGLANLPYYHISYWTLFISFGSMILAFAISIYADSEADAELNPPAPKLTNPESTS